MRYLNIYITKPFFYFLWSVSVSIFWKIPIKVCCYTLLKWNVARPPTFQEIPIYEALNIIGAQSYVNKDIPPKSIVFGIPAKIVGKVKVKETQVLFDYYK